MLGPVGRLLTAPHHYFAGLPYNWNWAVSGRRFAPFLRENPLRVVDVGARGGAAPELAGLAADVEYCGFDADAEECARLRDAPPRGFRAHRCLPAFIGGVSGKAQFHLYRRRELSSVYRQSGRYAELFAGEAEREIEGTLELEQVTLDEALAANAAESPDFLKLDTQGSELEILRGAPETLRRVPLVELEVEFCEVYRGQPLFHQVQEFMLAQGFELLYLNRVFQQRRNVYSGAARGQLVFGDALYGRTEAGWDELSAAELAKFAILLVNYGHRDIAYQVAAARPEVLEVCPGLGRYFRPGREAWWKRAVVSQLDKALCLGLHLRRYNGIRSESDRSWPVR